ncbi:SDR family oxidoreductase [Streptomyces sp. NPDC026673]|uniref:SDR family oxidoreductase n=1 Tax=Streptomyces sp. NPDC026673 TaxID=3155724 RepID=UPI003405545C
MSGQRFFDPSLMDGQVAVVTGGGSGLGLAISEALLRHGARVAIASRNAERLRAAAEGLTARTGRPCLDVVCDVRRPEQVQALRDTVTERLGPARVLVNNAAGNFRAPAEKMTLRGFSTVVDIDLTGTFNTTMAFLPDLRAAGNAAITSIVVPEPDRGFPGFAHAGAAKAAIVSLTRSWAREWGPYGIRVNAVGPGPVPTEGVAAHMLAVPDGDPAQAFAGRADSLPLGRLGTPQDIASSVLFLSSPAASWITGTLLHVDGGLSVA